MIDPRSRGSASSGSSRSSPGAASSPRARVLGPGDDAAVVATPDGRVVATTDVLVAGVHFRLDWSTPEQVGRKAAAANLADVAAMGAVPTALLVGLAAPADTPVETRRRAGRRPLGRGGGGRCGPGRRRRRGVGHAHARDHRARVARGAGTGHPVRGAAGRRGGARGQARLGGRGARGAAAGLPVARCGGGGAPGAGAAVRGGPGGRGGGRHGDDRRLGRPARRPRRTSRRRPAF